MTQEEIIEMAKQSDLGFLLGDSWLMHHEIEYFAKLIAKKAYLDGLENGIKAEREACAKMFDEAMPLVPFVQNDQGGCLVCGFTPKLAALAIRARGQA